MYYIYCIVIHPNREGTRLMDGILNRPHIDPFKPHVIKTSIEYGALLDEAGEVTTESFARWLTGNTHDDCFFMDVYVEGLTFLYHYWEREHIPYRKKKYMKKMVKQIQGILDEKLRVKKDGTCHWY